MNQTNLPSLASSDVVSDIEFAMPEAVERRSIDQKTLEIACVDLICKLENIFAKAKEVDKEEFVDESAATARKMLGLLIEFCNEHLKGKPQAQAQDEIEKAVTVSHSYDQVLKTRSLGKSIIRTFWSIEEPAEIKESHAQLVDALIRACAATFYHAIMSVGFESSVGQQIDQSTLVFVSELKQSW